MRHHFVRLTVPIQFLSLTILLLLVFPCTAELACSDAYPDNVPESSDCHHILTHLPSFPAFAARNRLQSASAPFPTDAQYLHDSCNVGFTYYPIAARFRQSLMEADTMDVWTQMRDSAIRIVETCIDTQRTGFDQVFLPHLDLFYLVQVSRPGAILNRTKRAQKQAMGPSGVRNRRSEEIPFWHPIYIV